MSTLEAMSKRILEAAITENRASELLQCLYEGGACTVDAKSGYLVLINAAQVIELGGRV